MAKMALILFLLFIIALSGCLTAAEPLDSVLGQQCVNGGHRSKRSLCAPGADEFLGKSLDEIRTLLRAKRFIEWGNNQFQCPHTGIKYTLVEANGAISAHVEIEHPDVPGYKIKLFADGAYQLFKRVGSNWVLVTKNSVEYLIVMHKFKLAMVDFIINKSPFTSETHGRETVDMAIAQVHGSGIFPDDKNFLRRIAWVESKFGDDRNTYRTGYNGGIWHIDRVWFEETNKTANHPRLKKFHQNIKDKFGIDWPSVQWSDLRKPLYSAIAARLGLVTKPERIPDTIRGQAAYWKTVYNSAAGAGSEQKFINDVNAMEGQN